jgi:hypothetical protein
MGVADGSGMKRGYRAYFTEKNRTTAKLGDHDFPGLEMEMKELHYGN